MVTAATMVVVLLACSGQPDRVPLAFAPTVRYMQVIAHADDDLLFMNPDLVAGIRAGTPTTGVYLTGGETDKPDPQAYTARRQAGTRAAYAQMAGVPDEWTAQRLDVDAHHSVEQYTMRARPQIHVVFVNLPENNDPRAVGGKEALVRLWNDETSLLRVGTLVPVGGVVPRSYFYTHDELVQLLVNLFTRFQPTVVRSQDPDPDNRLLLDTPRFHDHPDHVMAARFTAAATQLYRGPRFVSLNYRDYAMTELPEPHARGPPDQDRDLRRVRSPRLRLDARKPLCPLAFADVPAVPLGSSWTDAGRAYAVFNGALYACAPGSPWTELPWPGGPITQAVSAAGGWVVAKRETDNQIMLLADGSWRSLGDPSAQTGSPVTTGKAVYVKNPLAASACGARGVGGVTSAVRTSRTAWRWPAGTSTRPQGTKC
ncbi:hypothetical protein GCM10029964_117220 [Kibdelosporangium lantanae]